MKPAHLFSLTFVALVSTRPAFAEAVQPHGTNPILAEARAAFAEGRALMAEERYREAIIKFRQAAEVKETPGLRYYIAYCLEQLDELLEARAEYERAAELLKDFDAGDVRELLPEARARVDRSLATLIVDGLPAGATLHVDGNAAPAGGPVLLNPGAHQVEVRTPSGLPITTSIKLARGESHRWVPEAPPAPSPAKAAEEVAPAPPNAPRPSHSRPVVLWSSIGVAIVGAGVMGSGLVLRETNRARAEDLLPGVRTLADSGRCSGTDPDKACTDYENAVQTAHLGETLAIAGGIGFGVGAVSAVLVHFLWPAPGRERIEAHLSPQSAGFSFIRSF